MTAADILEVRRDPKLWFQGFGRVPDLVTQQPIRSKAKPLQRRGFAHYKHCQQEDVPCRELWIKGRRGGGSVGCSALVYLHSQNYQARMGQIGTNLRTAANMMAIVKHFGEHDDFPGWGIRNAKPTVEQARVSPESFYGSDLSSVPWEERTEKVIESKIAWPHGSSLELYTAENPESARSAGLQCFHWTEFFRAPKGGATDGGETLNAMIKTVPKRGFTFIGLEGTANGASGAGYELAKSARWPTADELGCEEGKEWWRKWETVWPQNVAKIGKELQFVLVFSAWYEDCENTLECTPEEERIIQATLDEREKALIARYECDGPSGRRLGDEVNTTVWNQLKWRRATIEHECKQGGAAEFDQEYPADPQSAFRASGSPALDLEGLTVLEAMARACPLVEYGQLSAQSNRVATWAGCAKDQATIIRWEEPIVPATPTDRGGRYLVVCDPMSGADMVTGNGEKDRHAVFVIRDAYTDHRGRYWPARIVARIKPPCQWEDEVLTRQLVLLGMYYGLATIVVESNAGAAILKALHNPDGYNYPNIYQREELDSITQKITKKLGWRTDEASRRVAISTLQKYVREQMFELYCLHAVGEMMTLVINDKGKVKAGGSNHDDDCLALAIGLECLHAAHEYPRPKTIRRVDPNDGFWK